MSLFIGLDSGTQSTKAVVFNSETGEVVAEARATYDLIPNLPPGHKEQHPKDWLRAVDQVVEEVLLKVDRQSIRGIGVSGQQHGFVPLDDSGAVIRPAKLWCDTSTTAECEIITKKLGGPGAAKKETGNLILPGYTASKILWLKRQEPAAYRRLRQILLPHDYINFHLTGKYSMEYGDASGTGLLNVRKRAWSKKAIQAIDPALIDYLPPLTSSLEAAGEVRPELTKRWQLRDEVIVSAGGGDNMMGAIGTGNIKPGIVTASLGTSGTIYAYAAEPVIDPQGEIAAFCSSTDGWLPLLCTMNMTSVTESVRALFGFDHAALEAAVRSVPAGAEGLLLLPYFSGERTPNIPNGSGVLLGWNQANNHPAHLARATLEGVMLGMNYGLLRLKDLGIKPREIRLTGGGSKSAVWRQLAADVFGTPVVAMKEDEGAALGAALQVAALYARRSGTKVTLAQLVTKAVGLDESTRALPNRSNHTLYRKLQEKHDQLSLTLRPTFAGTI